MARRSTILGAALGLILAPRASRADPASEGTDRFDLSVHGETYAELFRRALLPGPAGAIVETTTAAPLHQYVGLRALDLDAPWRADSIDVELSAWGRGWIGPNETEQRLDGDVQSANVRYHHGPASVRLGRQLAAGGAARYVRFDGATLGATFARGFVAEGYGGFTALPRWDARPGYHHLGAAADSLLRDPDALPDPERSGYRLAGGRLGWMSERANLMLSFHEQAEPLGLARRGLGLDSRFVVVPAVVVGGTVLAELDALAVQDARLYVDASPAKPLDLSAEVLHTEPALFLSRQSVLSVFSTEAYDEVGGSGVWRVTERFSVEGGGWIEIYDSSDRGARGEMGVRVLPGAGKRTVVRLVYGRVVAMENGYHSLRGSLSRQLFPSLTGTAEAYGYFYDTPIRDRSTSAVYAGTLSYQVARPLSVMWGASLAISPYADLDAQTLVRLAYDLDFSTRRAPR